MKPRPIIYCSGNAHELRKSNREIVSFWNLQFTNEKDADIKLHFSNNSIKVEGLEHVFRFDYGLKNIFDEISPLNLHYIEQLFNDKDDQIDMIQFARKELSQNLQDLNNAFLEKNGEQIKYFAHKLNSKLLVLSIPVLSACRFIENNAHDIDNAATQKSYYLLKMYCLIRLWQIKDI